MYMDTSNGSPANTLYKILSAISLLWAYVIGNPIEDCWYVDIILETYWIFLCDGTSTEKNLHSIWPDSAETCAQFETPTEQTKRNRSINSDERSARCPSWNWTPPQDSFHINDVESVVQLKPTTTDGAVFQGKAPHNVKQMNIYMHTKDTESEGSCRFAGLCPIY